MEARPSKLEIEVCGEARALIGVEDAELCFGCVHANDTAQCQYVPGRWVSRDHVRIVCDGQYFVLIDASTNGTFLQTEDGRTTFLRRGDVRLWGQGFFSLGEPPTKSNAVRFHHVD